MGMKTCQGTGLSVPSVITSKAANGYHFIEDQAAIHRL